MRKKLSSVSLAFCLAFLHGMGHGATLPPPLSNKKSGDGAMPANVVNDTVALPPNIIAPKGFTPIFREMTRRSPTFRDQLQRLGSAPRLRIKILLSPGLLYGHYRAVSTVSRHETGLVYVTIRIVAAIGNHVELISHEFEHALEQAEGLDLRALARVGGSRVYQLMDGNFETDRAIQAGRTVAREFQEFCDPNHKTCADNRRNVD